MATRKKGSPVRYAVVGQGYISQIAVLPAFKHARRNSQLAALVSDDSTKLKKLGKRYGVKNLYTYDQYEELVGSGLIDAVYISLPNHLHASFAIRAAEAGIHVLTEKPMEVTPEACEAMIEASERYGVKLMVAYRLHFEEGHLTMIEWLKKKRIGDPRVVDSVFTLAVEPRNYRAGPHGKGGGPVYDIGIYCINAARYLFRAEPTEVRAMSLGKIRDSEEATAVVLRFPDDRIANFVCSFGAYPCGTLEVIGTKGRICVDNAYEIAGDRTVMLDVAGGKMRTHKFKFRDQFGPELLYFSDCILKNKTPEPSGLEGLADVRIIRAILDSAETGRTVQLDPIKKSTRPGLKQEIHLPPVEKPVLVKVKEPGKDTAA